MITTDDLYKLIEDYLFLFPSKDKAIKTIFKEGLSFYKDLSEEDIEERISTNLSDYLKKQFESKKLPSIIKKYIKVHKILLKKDIIFLDNIIIESNYELTYEDIESLLNIKAINKYLESNTKDDTDFIKELRNFQEIQEEDEEEIETSEKCNVSDNYSIYQKDIRKYKRLTPEEERELLVRYKLYDDPDAYEKLVLCNQGLCKKVANKYLNRGLSLLDLIQECNIGLIKSLQKFELSKKTKLSTYAMWWIDQSARKAVGDQGTTIRLPLHVHEEQDKLKREESKYEREHGELPSLEKLSELTGFTKSKIKEIRKSELKAVSFDKKVQTEDDDGSTLGDFIKSDIESPEDLAIKKDEHDYYEKLFVRLGKDTTLGNPKRSEQVMRLRFGIEMYNEETYKLIKEAGLPVKDKYVLNEIKNIYGITRERIRQVETKAVNRLKYYSRSYEIELEGKARGTLIERKNGKQLKKTKKED